jgi:hypothetical protein
VKAKSAKVRQQPRKHGPAKVKSKAKKTQPKKNTKSGVPKPRTDTKRMDSRTNGPTWNGMPLMRSLPIPEFNETWFEEENMTMPMRFDLDEENYEATKL